MTFGLNLFKKKKYQTDIHPIEITMYCLRGVKKSLVENIYAAVPGIVAKKNKNKEGYL